MAVLSALTIVIHYSDEAEEWMREAIERWLGDLESDTFSIEVHYEDLTTTEPFASSGGVSAASASPDQSAAGGSPSPRPREANEAQGAAAFEPPPGSGAS